MFLLLIKAITSFLYILELLGIVFLLVSSCNKVFMRFSMGVCFCKHVLKCVEFSIKLEFNSLTNYLISNIWMSSSLHNQHVKFAIHVK